MPDPAALARRAARRMRRLVRGAPPAHLPGPAILSLDDIAALPRDRLEQACRELASPVYLGGGIALCRILTRYKFHLFTDDVGFGANVLLDGYWESWLTRYMARTVARGGVAIDVGANCGYYSLLLADLVGPEGRLIAVEPNPRIAGLLRRSVDLNGFAARTEIMEAALGAADGGHASLFVPASEPKNGALRPDAGGAAEAGERYEVALRTLDSVVGEGRVDFIKIDAEGAEEDIVRGMDRILSRRPAMVLEFNAARYADPSAFLQRLLAVYGSLRHVDYEGFAVPVAPARVLSERFGEDWLLVFGAS